MNILNITENYPNLYSLLYEWKDDIGENYFNTMCITFLESQSMYVCVYCDDMIEEWYTDINGINVGHFSSRKEAEQFGIKESFEILEHNIVNNV